MTKPLISTEILAASRARAEKAADTLLSKYPASAGSKMAQAALNDAGILHILALDFLELRAGHQRIADEFGQRVNARTQTLSHVGHVTVAEHGQTADADVRTSSTTGANKGSPLGLEDNADVVEPFLRGGQQSGADNGHSPAAPSQIPKPGKPRGIMAIAAAGVVVGESLLKHYRVRDGRPIGSIKWHELAKLAQENDRESRTFRYLIEHIANAPSHASVVDLVSEKTLADAFKFAEAAENVR